MMMNVYFINIGAPYRANTFPDPDRVQAALTTVAPIQMPLREIYDGLELALQNSAPLNNASYAAFEDPSANRVIFAALEPVGVRYGGDGTQRVIVHVDPFATMRGSAARAWTLFESINCTSVSPQATPTPNYPTARIYEKPEVLFSAPLVVVVVQFEYKADATAYETAWCHTEAVTPLMARNIVNSLYLNTVIHNVLNPEQPTDAYTEVRALRAYAVPNFIFDATVVTDDPNYEWSSWKMWLFLSARPRGTAFLYGENTDGGRFYAGNPISFATVDTPIGGRLQIVPRLSLNGRGDELAVQICATPVHATGSPPAVQPLGGDPAIVHDITASLTVPIRSRPRTVESSVDGVKDALNVASGVLAVGTGIVTGNPLAVVGGGLSLAGTATSILEREEAKERQRNERVTIAGDFYGASALADGAEIGCFAVWCAPYAPACVNLAELTGCETSLVLANSTTATPRLPYAGKDSCYLRGEPSARLITSSAGDPLTMSLAKMQADIIKEGVLFLRYEN